MDSKTVKNIVEAALFAAGRPVDVNELLRLFDEADRPTRKEMREALDELSAEYEERAVEISQVASGYRVQVRARYGEWIGRMADRRPPRYSRALMETLALIAYRQPVTRGEIENVRGVTVSSNIVRTLLERGWIRIVGHRDVPGRPAMLGTTKEFLDYFGLKSLDELPSLTELQDIDSINVELDFGGAQGSPEQAAIEEVQGETAHESEQALHAVVDPDESDDDEPVLDVQDATGDNAQPEEEQEETDETAMSVAPGAR